jgi:hypothetical protein
MLIKIEYLRTSLLLGESDNKLIDRLMTIKNKKDDSISSYSDEVLTQKELQGNEPAISNESFQIKESTCLEVSEEFLNFEIFFPGETKRKFLRIKNLIYDNCILEFKFSSNIYIKNHFEKFYMKDNEKHINQEIENSQNKFNNFNLFEAGVFTKIISFGKNEQKEIEVLMTSPFVKTKKEIFAVLEILQNKKVIQSIPLYALIEVPKLLCLKELYADAGSLPLVHIMLQPKTSGQKFKIPFKNLSFKDMVVEFFFEKRGSNSIIYSNDNYYEFQFMCFPNEMSIQSHSNNTINLIAKVRKIRLDENTVHSEIRNKIRKVLIAKIKGASVYYSFFLEASLANKS